MEGRGGRGCSGKHSKKENGAIYRRRVVLTAAFDLGTEDFASLESLVVQHDFAFSSSWGESGEGRTWCLLSK